MVNNGMDASWITTAKTPSIQRTSGLNSLNVLNHIIAHTFMLVTVNIQNMGEYRLKSVQVTEDKQYVLVICVDQRGQEFSQWVPWYTKFNLYLGDR